MFSTVTAGAVLGIESRLACVEVDTSPGLPGFEMVGLPGSEVREAKERIRVALRNSEMALPPLRITVNIAPADLRKEGTAFDFPIAVGILISLGMIPQEMVEHTVLAGELGLNGEIRPVRGILPIVDTAKRMGKRRCLVPVENVREGAVIQGIELIGVSSLAEATEYLNASERVKECMIPAASVNPAELFAGGSDCSGVDFSDIHGQETVKRAAAVAAAGFHHLLLTGPPGSGKTMVARRLPTILPPLSMEESLEVTRIYSVSGLLKEGQALVTERPFLNPHHTISRQAMIGGGRVPRPGMVSLAHRGVLFLDELAEFGRNVLDTLRQPLEDRCVQIARSSGNYTFPADFILVGAMNLCPCGYYPDRKQCRCTPNEMLRYQSRISGPVMDRMDICTEAPGVKLEDLTADGGNESSSVLRERVMEARERQQKRYEGSRYRFNTELSSADIKKFCPLGTREQIYMEQIFSVMHLSARAYHRMLRVARTIADLEGCDQIAGEHLAEAFCYRTGRDKAEGS